MKRLLPSAAAALLWLGCTQSPPHEMPPPVVTEEAPPDLQLGQDTTTLPVDHPWMGPGGAGGAGGSGGAGGAALAQKYGARRLSVAQVEASVKAIFGDDAAGNPITWKIGAADGFASRRASLGVPDFLNIVDESLEPSPLFLKFMTDMAGSVCTQGIVADRARAAADKVLTRFVQPTDTVASAAARVDENLRYLKLVFHGTKVNPGDELPIAQLRTLYGATVSAAAGTATVTQTHTDVGWRTVCVALLTSPEFHIY